MIVRLDLERACPAVTDVNDARILARALHHKLRARRQTLQMHARRLVGAMLAPHHAEDAQFGQGRRTSAEQLLDLGVLVGRKAVFADEFRSNGRGLRQGHGRKLYCRMKGWSGSSVLSVCD